MSANRITVPRTFWNGDDGQKPEHWAWHMLWIKWSGYYIGGAWSKLLRESFGLPGDDHARVRTQVTCVAFEFVLSATPKEASVIRYHGQGGSRTGSLAAHRGTT